MRSCLKSDSKKLGIHIKMEVVEKLREALRKLHLWKNPDDFLEKRFVYDISVVTAERCEEKSPDGLRVHSRVQTTLVVVLV